MMKDITELVDVPSKPYKAGKRLYSDTIYTFDIEATNMFLINGKWQPFDKSIPQKSYDTPFGDHVTGYDEIEKAVCPYIGMFSVNDTVYMFRDVRKFEDCLKAISNPQVTKFVYIHNLAYEMAFFRYLWVKYEITDLIARKSRQPIQFYIPALNIIIRCSLRLTELSLEKCGEQYTNINKKSGDLDYDLMRSPLTPLTDAELGYCEYDCLVLYETIKYFRARYKHIKSIPSTQTGEVRKAYKKAAPINHIYKMRKLVPSLHEYKMLFLAFQGGLTHANAVHANRVLYEQITSYDEASAYPAVMACKKYPVERFKTIDPKNIEYYKEEKYAFIYDVTLEGVESKYYNTYIPAAKVLDGTLKHPVFDNGRIVSCDCCRMVLTDVDFRIIKKAYKIHKITIHEVMAAKKDYLPDYFINFMLELYRNKTAYKGIEGKEEIYMKSKQLLNSLFGCCCTRIVQSTVSYVNGEWFEGAETDAVIRKKLQEQRESNNILFSYSTGVWVTAFNRERLFEKILDIPEMDGDVVYYDTDSLKIRNGFKYVGYFKMYDRIVDEELKDMCIARGIDYALTRPKDPAGNEHPLGHWEVDAVYEEFCTLGAKRYAYRKGGKVGITVAGVGKGNDNEGYAADALNNDLENFNEYLVFDYDHAHKLEHSYIENMKPWTFEDYNGVPYHATWEDGVVLKPTTYSMSLTDAYRALVSYLFDYLHKDGDILDKRRLYNGKEGFIR